MTVNELITKLSQLDPTLPVYSRHTGYQEMEDYTMDFDEDKSIECVQISRLKIKNRWKDIAIVSEY